ncbi:phosphatase 2C-like domain-containing protein [Fimicolochytrium jonesii]|uniref:phosphatase 2C-like domain-containing protein n=1 Tax=Fimicolochytrium jonesii TaxID=1396493 RepID=UPI0022FE3058|nr:phosphatase 2C-like domain-containing protein [Fimicolochytrium jonesii]KAI8819971.1 phosphatase 2C-like domain-containing protein [Fimicolochytrium jonesii]
MKKLLPSFAGAVGLVAYITPKTIHLAHAGDVRCVAQSTDGQIHSTMDHQAETPSEAARLRKEHPGEEDTVVCLRKGEEPSADGQQPPLRVIGLLMPSRSFGDAHSKWSVEWQEKLKPILEFFPTAKRLGIAPLCKTPPYITAHPDITPLPHPGQRFLVISTDGITDSLSSEDIASTVSSTLATEDSQNKNLAGILARKALGGGKFDDEEAGRRLALEGRERREWRDDITVLVVVFE